MIGQMSCEKCGIPCRLGDLYVLWIERKWWNPARWIYGKRRFIDVCRECSWSQFNDR